jgi:multisubunit Na+/H+ antiporter MnhE subunit
MKLISLVLRYALDFIRANLTIARQLLSPKLDVEPQSITLKTQVRTPAEILALSNMITFTPGTLTLDLQPEGDLVVHVLNDPEATARDIQQHLEKPLLEITRPTR